MKEAFYIYSQDPLNNDWKYQWREIRGRRVEIPGIDGYVFFIHRPINSTNKYWHISELITGCCVEWGETQKDTIEKASVKLLASPLRLRWVVDRAIANNHTSPLYTKG